MTQTLYAREYGAGPDIVVLLHGFGAFHGIWHQVAVALGEQARTIAYDLPGHGQSLDCQGAGSAKTAARAILADLDARNIEKAHLVGHSMGGAVAALAALGRPERVASLTLLAPGGFGEEINAPLLQRYARATSLEELRDCLAEMSAPGFSPPPDAVRALAAMRERAGQTEMLVSIANLITRDGRQGVIPHELLKTLTMPVAIAWGTEDPVLPFSQTGNLPPAFGFLPIPGAGHMLAEEHPGLVIDLVRRMIRR